MSSNDRLFGNRVPDTIHVSTRIGSLLVELSVKPDIVISSPSEQHNHFAYEAHYYMSGSGTLLIEDREEPIGPGTTLLIGPNMYHSIRVHPNDPVSRYLLQFTYTEPAHDADDFRRREGGEIPDMLSGFRYKSITDPDPDRSIALIREVYREQEHHLVGYHSTIQSLMVHLFVRLIRSLSAEPSQLSIPPQLADERRTQMIDTFFDRYEEQLTIRDLAAQLHLSTKQTNRILHKYYRTSFKQKQLSTRMQVAMELLRTSRLSVEDIAARIGYASAYHFCRLFRKKTGMTPSQYRDRDV